MWKISQRNFITIGYQVSGSKCHFCNRLNLYIFDITSINQPTSISLCHVTFISLLRGTVVQFLCLFELLGPSCQFCKGFCSKWYTCLTLQSPTTCITWPITVQHLSDSIRIIFRYNTVSIKILGDCGKYSVNFVITKL